MIDECFAVVEPLLGTKTACAAVGRARATHYRRLKPCRTTRAKAPARTAEQAERRRGRRRARARCARSASSTPRPTRSTSPCSTRGPTWPACRASIGSCGRNDEVRERRRQATHPAKVKPELVADRPLVVWSWDITKLKGPKRGEYYDLYVVLDIFSRYVVAWCVAPSESGELAKDLIADAVARHRVPPDQLTIHADRGSSMTSNQVAELLSFLGIKRSHSRPHVSNDNPYSEAQFKTLKYCPGFPERFGSIADARVFCEVVLRVLQPRPPSLGHRVPHARLGALRHRHRGAHPAGRDPRGRLRGEPDQVPPPQTRAAEAPDHRLDQRTGEHGGAHSEGVVRRCLKSLDRFRQDTRTHRIRVPEACCGRRTIRLLGPCLDQVEEPLTAPVGQSSAGCLLRRVSVLRLEVVLLPVLGGGGGPRTDCWSQIAPGSSRSRRRSGCEE